ncbi:MAG: O-antigen ligase family protein [Acidobacteriota bacterium]
MLNPDFVSLERRLRPAALFLGCGALVLLMLAHNPFLLAAALALGVGVGIASRWPELATLAVVCFLYSNVGGIATQLYGVPSLVAGSASLLLLIPLTDQLFLRQENLVADRTFIWMFMFLFALLISSVFAKDLKVAVGWTANFVVEGLVLYWLVVNVVRRPSTLRRIIWVLLLTGALLGALSLFQEVTHSYENQFGGLAQRNRLFVTKETAPDERVRTGDRAQGPLGDPNRYAQILLMILPLAFFQYWVARHRWKRIVAAAIGLLILSGILLSYSRGAFVTIVVVILLAPLLRMIRPSRGLAAVGGLVIMALFAAPGYLTRLETLWGVEGLFSRQAEIEPEAVIRGRTTEMLAALMVFLDHPLLGVGPGNYTPFYSMEYQLNPAVAFRDLPKPRRAHTLYFELAAETGLIGLCLFMAIVGSMLRRLWVARSRMREAHPDLAGLATAFFFGIVCYLGTALFLHMSYQRYYWLLLGLAGAALRIFQAREKAPVDAALEPMAWTGGAGS